MTTLSQHAHLRSTLEFLDHTVLERFPPLAEFARNLGRTPLIQVPSVRGGARIFAKCEWFNPTGTVKDRTAFAMLYRLLQDQPGTALQRLHVLEYSGGSLAMSLSGLCGRLGLRRTLAMGSFVTPEAVAAMEREGSDVVLVDKEKGFWAVMEKAFELATQHPQWSFLYQHANPANLWVHRVLTGGELLQQLHSPELAGLQPAAWVASIGTGGSLAGVYQALAPHYPGLELYGVTPAELPYGSPLPPNGLPKYAGSGGLGSGRKQAFVEAIEEQVSAQLTVTFDESIRAMARFCRETGHRIGSSAAANWLAARQVARRFGPDRVVLTLFPSLPTPAEWAKAEQILFQPEGSTDGFTELAAV